MHKNVPIDDIIVPRAIRQRTTLTYESVADLALSIARNGVLLQRILLQDDLTIVAGERRLTALRLLNLVYNNTDPNAINLRVLSEIPEAKLAELRLAASKPPSWSEKWAKVPATIKANITELESMVFEFIENAHREDISWLDRAKAVYTIHAHCRKDNPGHTAKDTAQLLSYSPASISRFIEVWSEYLKAPEVTQTHIKDSSSINAAGDVLRRQKSRKAPQISFRKVVNPTVPGSASETPEPSPQSSPQSYPQSSPILNESFLEWAPSYTGPKFNCLHCDFPYGIALHKGAGQYSAADNKSLAEYDDSPEIYWELLQSLADNQQRIITPSCHIIFWFSQNYLQETKDFFKANFPGCTIQDHLMIWHRTDNSGILPDPSRYGRRTYDTAMLITLGDRLNAKAKALSYGCAWGEKIHRSQKPLEVVSHFLSMFVDESSRVLDPTCGSGTAIIAAKNLGASQVLGLEINPDTHKAACSYYNSQT